MFAQRTLGSAKKYWWLSKPFFFWYDCQGVNIAGHLREMYGKKLFW